MEIEGTLMGLEPFIGGGGALYETTKISVHYIYFLGLFLEYWQQLCLFLLDCSSQHQEICF